MRTLKTRAIVTRKCCFFLVIFLSRIPSNYVKGSVGNGVGVTDLMVGRDICPEPGEKRASVKELWVFRRYRIHSVCFRYRWPFFSLMPGAV